MTDRPHGLIQRLASGDPWEQPDREMGDSCCHFCGSEYHPDSYREKPGRHFNDCVWVEAQAFLGIPLDENNTIYIPPEPKTCEDCGIVTTYDHHGRVDFNGDTTTHWEHLRSGMPYITRRLIDSLPPFTLPRGKIEFIHPTIDLSNIREPDND